MSSLWLLATSNRVANGTSDYVTGFCLGESSLHSGTEISQVDLPLQAVLIFYSPRRVKAAFWSQTLITYSLLITCITSLFQGSLSRFHAIILVSIVCSPVNVYFSGYSIRAFWSSHRLDPVLGKKQYARRGLVFLSIGAWIAILVYAYLPSSHTKFAQEACRGSSVAEGFFLGAPFIYAYALVTVGPAGILLLFLFLMIPILIAIAWVVAIIRRRKEIWPPGKPWRPRFGKVW